MDNADMSDDAPDSLAERLIIGIWAGLADPFGPTQLPEDPVPSGSLSGVPAQD